AVAHEREHKERPRRLADPGAQTRQRVEICGNGGRQTLAALFGTGCGSNDTNLLDDAFAGESVRHRHKPDACRLQHRYGLLRTCAFDRQDQRRVEPEHALWRNLAEVADTRLLAQRLRWIVARLRKPG